MHLHRAWAHKGGCGLWWAREPPRKYEQGQGLEVLDDSFEPVDYWMVDECVIADGVRWVDYHEYLRRLSYDEYLRSRHWFALRAEANEHYGKTCVLCGSADRIEVHHRSYANVGRETMADLIVLCRRCHAHHHGRAA